MDMRRGMLFAVHCVLFLSRLANAQPLCNTQLQLSLFLDESYSANANLIRFGVPSEAVGVFYNDALRYLAQHCKCGSTLLDETCVDTKFNSDKEVSSLRAVVDSDEGIANASKLFRLYDSQKTLYDLTKTQEESFKLGLELVNLNTHDLDIILSLGWQGVQFPSDDSFFQDDSLAQKTACSSYSPVTLRDEFKYPASAATAYVLSLVQNVRRAGGNLTIAYELLANHTSLVFNGVRCQKLSGDKLKIPIEYMRDYKNQAQKLLDESKGETSSVDLNDVRGVSSDAKLYLHPLVQKFSSLISYGDSETVLYTRSGLLGGELVERISVDTVLQNDLSLIASSSLLGSIVSGISATTQNAHRGTCSAGWIFVSRAVSLMSADEECCSDKCELLGLSLSDPFLWSIEQEDCCANCNLFVCQHQTLLPESIPLNLAPPTSYPTSVDL